MTLSLISPRSTNPRLSRVICQQAQMPSSVQRLYIGATGLLLRPTIDYYNWNVDPTTRKYSALKTAVKVVITVFNGILTRILAEKAGEWMARHGWIKPISTELAKDLEKASVRNAFAKSVALVISFLATVLTTFTLDIPLINSGLNFALEKSFPNKPNVKPDKSR